MEKPQNISIAVKLLWAVLAFGLARSVITITQPVDGRVPPIPLVVVTCVVVFGLLSLLILKISAGRNWARITYTVLFGIGLPITVIGIFVLLGRSLLQSLLAIVQLGLQIGVIILMFTKPGSAWFGKHEQPPAESDS